MDIEDKQRALLSKAMTMYAEKFDDYPEFGHKFPKLHLVPFYVSEINKAVKNSKPIVVDWQATTDRFID
jgi:hypothetical protein|tara:strand:+ start:1366 stop:1572 length:207 start_codon:yes stop_codon:yes gene_type:complete